MSIVTLMDIVLILLVISVVWLNIEVWKLRSTIKQEKIIKQLLEKLHGK